MVIKRECPECKEQKKLARFKFNPVKDKRLCYECDRRIGHNKFYFPQIKGIKKEKNYLRNIDWEEKKVLYKEKLKDGKSESTAKNEIRQIGYMIKIINKNKREYKPETTNINKNFIEGLKNK